MEEFLPTRRANVTADKLMRSMKMLDRISVGLQQETVMIAKTRFYFDKVITHVKELVPLLQEDGFNVRDAFEFRIKKIQQSAIRI